MKNITLIMVLFCATQLVNAQETIPVSGGEAAGDTYENVEAFLGTSNADRFEVNADAILAGGEGNDTFEIDINQSGRPVVVWGGSGADRYDFNRSFNDGAAGILVVNVDNITEDNFHQFSLESLGNINLDEIDTNQTKYPLELNLTWYPVSFIGTKLKL